MSASLRRGRQAGRHRRDGETPQARALHGLSRALIQNMMNGVTEGYEKKLEIVGVGYLAAIQKDILQLRVGFANEIHMPIPAGLERHLPRPDARRHQGQRQAIGRPVCRRGPLGSQARAYKGKGMRYEGEVVRRKAGKAMTK